MTKVGFVSLGCPKNLVDSEVMLGILSGNGYEITDSCKEAEIIVVNTCGFIESARQESVDTILEMARWKEVGSCRRLIVAGCLVERYRNEIRLEIPEVDAVVGTNEIPKILEACARELPPRYEHRELYLYDEKAPRVLSTPRFSTYVKIAEGCDHPCTFCVIPQMRGRFRSRSIDSVLEEVRRLVAGGTQEINLVGQDTTMFGWDHGNRRGLADLIRRLGEVENLSWVRFLYAYPNNVYDDLLEAVAETPNACKYIDVPLQHASRGVLRGMKRGGNRRSLMNLVARIRRIVPEVTIRTTFIVGFPGETEEDFRELRDFVGEAEFDRLGVFAYSDEEESESFGIDSKVPPEVAEERRRELMLVQARISRSRNGRLVGRTLPVLVEGLSPESELLWQGRLSSQAPEIDGVVYLTDGATESLRSGSILPVRITEAHDYDLVGRVTA